MKVSVEHEALAESMQSLVDAAVAAAASSGGGRAVDYAETEKVVAEWTAAIERAAHAEALRAPDVDASPIRVQGVLYAKLRREPGTFVTMASEAVVERAHSDSPVCALEMGLEDRRPDLVDADSSAPNRGRG